jgi:Flp pilus assembly protein TadG
MRHWGRVRSRPRYAPAGGAARQRGQALAELALVTPILVLLIMAIVQFAYVLETQMGITNAVREAARRAAADVDPDTNANLATSAGTLTQLDALLAANIQGYDPGRLWKASDDDPPSADSPQVTFCSYSFDGGATTNYRVTVYVKYRNPVFFPLLSYATDLVDGRDNGTWDLSAQASMRLEGVPVDPPSGECSP